MDGSQVYQNKQFCQIILSTTTGNKIKSFGYQRICNLENHWLVILRIIIYTPPQKKNRKKNPKKNKKQKQKQKKKRAFLAAVVSVTFMKVEITLPL